MLTTHRDLSIIQFYSSQFKPRRRFTRGYIIQPSPSSPNISMLMVISNSSHTKRLNVRIMSQTTGHRLNNKRTTKMTEPLHLKPCLSASASDTAPATRRDKSSLFLTSNSTTSRTRKVSQMQLKVRPNLLGWPRIREMAKQVAKIKVRRALESRTSARARAHRWTGPMPVGTRKTTCMRA